MPVVDGLSQQVAIFRGNDEKYLVHLSGIHGVEGYAGSAAQAAILEYITSRKLYSEKTPSLPTIILIHASNPYGFKNNRRTNENNVDLNRNFLTSEQWDMVKARDPNYAHYVELDKLLNPTSMPSKFKILNDIYHLLTAAYHITKYDFTTIKRAMVSGNYHKLTGYGFGGFELSQSAKNIITLLRDQEKIPEKAKAFYVLDVHTGLGPTGVDTLMFDDPFPADQIESLYPTQYNNKGKVVGGIKSFTFGAASSTPTSDNESKATKASTKEAEAVGSGYDLTIGTTQALCSNWIAKDLDTSGNNLNRICLAQEFGTVATFWVGKNSIEENYAHFHGSDSEKEIYKRDYRPCFYVETKSWKRNVVSRGLLVFVQTLDYIMN